MVDEGSRRPVKDIIVFLFWLIAIPFIVIFVKSDEVISRNREYLKRIRTWRLTAFLILACAALIGVLMIAKGGGL